MVKVEQIARTCHEVNRAYCQSIGDNSQPSWEDAPEWQKKSAIQGVKHYIGDPSTTPAEMHSNWCKYKVSEGWSYGRVKDPDAKKHPCLVPYHELPEEQKIKDNLFISVIKSMI